MITAAVDIGTTSIRAGVYGATGDLLGFARIPLSISHPFDGAVEQDPVEIVDGCVSMLRAAVEAAGLTIADVASLGVTNQRATVVAWDAESGTALGPAIGWQDTRTSVRVAELVAVTLAPDADDEATRPGSWRAAGSSSTDGGWPSRKRWRPMRLRIRST